MMKALTHSLAATKKVMIPTETAPMTRESVACDSGFVKFALTPGGGVAAGNSANADS